MNKFEQMSSSDEQAKIEASRVLSDADLLEGGAKYKIGANGQKRLEVEPHQIMNARSEYRNATTPEEIKVLRKLRLELHGEKEKAARAYDLALVKFRAAEALLNDGKLDKQKFVTEQSKFVPQSTAEKAFDFVNDRLAGKMTDTEGSDRTES